MRENGLYQVAMYEGAVKGGKLEKGNGVKDAAWKNPKSMARGSIAAPVISFLGSLAPAESARG